MGEVIVTVAASQFEIEPGSGIMESEFECGEFSGATLKYAVAPGHTPTATPEDIDQAADAYYIKYVGPNLASDTNGTSVDVMHQMITDNGQKYLDLTAINPNSQQASDIAVIKDALNRGYPIVATIAETSVVDLDLGRNPYSWGPAGTHIVLYTGIAPDGNLLVHDTANIVGPLMVNNTIMPQPRRYDINQIGTHWATMVQMPWNNNFDGTPTTQGADMIPVLTWNKTLVPGSAKEQQAKDIWGDAITWDSGIADLWKRMYAQGYKAGSPVRAEVKTVDENGSPIMEREFATGLRVEYNLAKSSARAFTLTQEVKFQ